MPDKKCPHGGLRSTSSAISCDCGYNFEKGILEEAFYKPVPTRKTFPFPIVSLSLSIIGILISPLLLIEKFRARKEGQECRYNHFRGNFQLKMSILIGLMLATLTGCSLELPAAAESSPDPAIAAAPAVEAAAPPGSLANEQAVLINLYRRANPAVVNIAAYGGQPGLTQTAPGGPEGAGPSQGSGFVYDQTGHIVTNAHVVNGATEIEIIFIDGTISEAALVGLDPHSDLVVLARHLLAGHVGPVLRRDPRRRAG